MCIYYQGVDAHLGKSARKKECLNEAETKKFDIKLNDHYEKYEEIPRKGWYIISGYLRPPQESVK